MCIKIFIQKRHMLQKLHNFLSSYVIYFLKKINAYLNTGNCVRAYY